MAEGHGGARPGSGRWSKDELEALKRGDSDDLVSRIKGRSFASIRAKRAELKRKPEETEKTDLEKIAAEPKKSAGTSLAMARVIEASKALKAQESRRHELNPFQVAQHPPRATPPKKYQMAMDQSVGWASNAWLGEVGGVLASAGAEGLFFLGYPFLAELAQRSEYRVISETIADDATRKWIDFEVTGSETEKEPSIEDPEEMREAGALDKSPEAVEAENALESKTRGFKDEDPDERKKKIESAGKMDKVKALKDEMARLELRDRFYNISRDDGFFGRSHLFMDFGVDIDDNRGELGHDIGDGRNKTTQGKIEKGSLKRLKVIEPVWIYPTTYNATNPLKEDWYNPQIWYVMGKMVHASRMPTFVGHPVPDLLKPAYSFGGLALSQMAKPYVDIWLTTRESIGSLIHSFSVMCLETDMQTALQGSGFDNVMMRVAMFNALRDNQGTFVTNKNTEGFKNVSAPLSGLHELQAQAQEHMASVSRIPLVKLTGISPSGLNASSEGEIRAYYDTIAAYQNRFFRPHLTKVLNFMQLSLWGEIDPEITFEFEPLWEMSQKEKSEKEKDDATRDQTYVDIGAFSSGEIRKIKIDDPTLPYTDMDPEDVPDLREEEEQGLEPQGGRPQPLAEAGPELGEGGIEPSGRGQDESPERSGLAWGDQYEWMRGYDLPTTRRDGAVIVKEAPQGSIACGKGLRVGSRVRLADGSTGRVFGFVQNAGGDSGVSVAVLDTERDRVVFPAEEAVSTRPVAAEDEWRGGGQDASLVPFGGDVDPLFESLAGDVEFEEGDHPRGEGGKFKSKGGEKDGSTAAKAIPPQETPSSGWWKTYQAKKTEGGKFQAPQLGLPYGAAAQPSSWVSGGAAPEPPRPPLDPKKLKRVGEQMGSNPGGVFEDESGKRYYVKHGKSAEHVKNELLAAALYKLAGTPLLKYRAVEGGKHIATEMAKLDKDNANKLSPSEIKEARKDFVPHAWLANWDAAGLGGDNLGTVKGVPTALDLGGSLAYRAQGAPKGEAFGTKVGELDSLRDPKVNKDTAKIFGEMTPSEMRESASYVTNVRDSDIKRAVKEAGVDASMVDKLIARKNDIAQRAKTFGAEGKPDKPTSTVIFPAGDELPVKELNGVAFKPWRPPADWAGVEGQNESLEEPPLDTKGKQASSGLIMREPDGRVWMVRPKGGFGGYEHTFSKGRVDKGLSLQANAIKETWEESGLKGKIVGFAGDHEGDTTMTRYYLAEREGGDPSQHDQETDGVVLAPPNKLSGFLNRKRDQDIAKSLGGDQALDEDGASGFSHIDRSFETSLEDRDETKLDKLGYLQGLKKIKMEPDHDQWHSRYDGEKDEIVLEGKFEDLDDQEKMRTLLHEAGHRGQLLADTEGFEEFKKRGLAKEEFFVEMANKTHMEDFERRGVVDGEAGEVFAESYARFCLGMDLPEVLAEFWSEREKALETDAAWHN